ncbi:MAG: 30S ribosomal protein S2 [bacterium]|nr:30S ribosomal protein S2 [bacterium]
MYQITMKQLLEAGIHFGHQTKRWNPKMARYIYTERNGIYVLDLQQTLKLLEVAYNYVRDLTASGGTVLFVGTKRQAQEAIKHQAERCGASFVNQRWLGGTLTNFQTIRKRTDYLHELEGKFKNNDFPGLTKKEILKLRKRYDKLQKFFGGVKNMNQVPDCIFIVDLKKEHNAVREAKKLGIPVAAILDTNCDPDDADIPIPGNDDAVKAINLFCETVANAIIEGHEGRDFGPGGEIPSIQYDSSTQTSDDSSPDISLAELPKYLDKVPGEYPDEADKV